MKISVIMAVYNARSTMDRMLQSLQEQTLDDFEIIIVDDGSTDGSSMICDEYAAHDKRIKVIHQDNGGVSAARQTGLNAACGKYVIHADADDYVEPMMLERLYAKAEEENADVVFSDYFVDESDGKVGLRIQKPLNTSEETLVAMLSGHLLGSCCNKLVRRTTLLKYGIRFPEGLNYCEDLHIWVQLLQHPNVKTTYVNKAFYHYVTNYNSATRKGSVKMLQAIRLFTKKMAESLPRGNAVIERYIATLPIAPFQYAFQNRLVSDNESRAEYKRLRRVIWSDTRSIRWKIGYIMIELHLMHLARKLLRL